MLFFLELSAIRLRNRYYVPRASSDDASFIVIIVSRNQRVKAIHDESSSFDDFKINATYRLNIHRCK
jgi:hypothetical protein